jgi:hypothetical protein
VAIPPQKAALAGAPVEAGSKRRGDELAEECGRVEEELEALKAKYEMYFLGTERAEPVRWREEVKKKVARLKTAFTNNTGLRFRMQSLHARYLAYERLWLRAAREREEGTYRRDLFKARRHARDPRAGGAAAGPAGGAAPRRDAGEGAPAPVSDAPTGRPAEGGSNAVGGPQPRPPPPVSHGLGEREMHALYESYVAAKRSCNEDVSRVTYEAMARSVARQVPEILARSKAKSVEFKVVVKDGRAVLKAVPRA